MNARLYGLGNKSLNALRTDSGNNLVSIQEGVRKCVRDPLRDMINQINESRKHSPKQTFHEAIFRKVNFEVLVSAAQQKHERLHRLNNIKRSAEITAYCMKTCLYLYPNLQEKREILVAR